MDSKTERALLVKMLEVNEMALLRFAAIPETVAKAKQIGAEIRLAIAKIDNAKIDNATICGTRVSL